MRVLQLVFVGVIALVAVPWPLTVAHNVPASSPHRLVEVTGFRNKGSLTTRVDIFLEVAPDQDEATLAKNALADEGAYPLSNSSPKFVLSGFKWPQFFDQNPTNDIVWQSYNPNGQNTIGDPLEALQSAEQEWTDVSSTSFVLGYHGTTTLGAGYDGINVVSWPSVWNHAASAFAVTLTAFDLNTNSIVDSDIVVNRNFKFFSQPSQVTPDRIDIRYVLLHENGHLAGLDHSLEPSAVMYDDFKSGVVGHVLASDDINGISTLYPANSTSPPVSLKEEGTNDAAAVDSVSQVRGPFSILTSHNFSADGHTRVILFTSILKLPLQQNPDSSIVSVQASGVPLPVEIVGPLTGVAGLSASFIVVRLPDQLSPGTKQLIVTLRGMSSTATTLVIQ
jgi:hypothetical protein